MKSKMTFWRKLVNPIAVVLGLAVILLAAQPVWAKVVDRVVATVNGVIITLSTVQERAAILKQQMQASGNSLKIIKMRNRALRDQQRLAAMPMTFEAI
ncbi:MAG: hypothetical protein IIC55_04365 [Proteobacteria bacterium]|nr:hypothetical protein [Pseudomonadota bacterium]